MLKAKESVDIHLDKIVVLGLFIAGAIIHLHEQIISLELKMIFKWNK